MKLHIHDIPFEGYFRWAAKEDFTLAEARNVQGRMLRWIATDANAQAEGKVVGCFGYREEGQVARYALQVSSRNTPDMRINRDPVCKNQLGKSVELLSGRQAIIATREWSQRDMGFSS